MADHLTNMLPTLHSELTLNELRHVLLLHRTLSFNRAAEQAGVSQSALSQSISRIEQRLGVVLFNRTRRNVTATTFADVIAERAESVLNALEEMDSRIGAMRETQEGSVRFGMGLVPAAMLLNDAMAAFRAGHPRIKVKAIVDYPDEILSRAVAGDIEFMVAADLAQIRDYSSEHERLFEFRNELICRPGHPLTELNVISFRDLMRYPAVSFPNRFMKTRMLNLMETSEEIDLLHRNYPAVETQQPADLANLVATTDFVMYVPNVTLRDWVSSGRLVTRRIDDLDSSMGVDLVWRQGVSLSPAAEEMMNILRNLSAALD